MSPQKAPLFFAKEVSGARRFYHTLVATSRKPLQVVTGGVEHCGIHYCIDRASFPFLTVEYVSRGYGELTIAGKRFELRSGCVFAYDKGMPHRISCGPHGNMVKYFVAYAGRDAARLLDGSGLVPGSVAQVLPADSLIALFEELVWAGTRGDSLSEKYCCRILRCLVERLGAALVPGSKHEPASFQKYLDCRDVIEQAFLVLHNTNDITRRCSLSEVHLCHLFQRYGHESPYRMLTRLKITHAAGLIQESDILIRDAAAAVGYGDPFHFSRVFRGILGVPPRTWRLMNAAKNR